MSEKDGVGSPARNAAAARIRELFQGLAAARGVDATKLQRAAEQYRTAVAPLLREQGYSKAVIADLLRQQERWRKARSTRPFLMRSRGPGAAFQQGKLPPVPLRALLDRAGLALSEPWPEMIPDMFPEEFQKPRDLGRGVTVVPIQECVFDRTTSACGNQSTGGGSTFPPNYPTDVLRAEWGNQCTARLQIAASGDGVGDVHIATGVACASESIEPMGDEVYCFTPTVSMLGALSCAIPHGDPASRLRARLTVWMALRGADPNAYGWTYTDGYALDFLTEEAGFKVLPIAITSDQITNLSNGGPLTIEHRISDGRPVGLELGCVAEVEIWGSAAVNLDLREAQDYGLRSWSVNWGSEGTRYHAVPMPSFQYL